MENSPKRLNMQAWINSLISLRISEDAQEPAALLQQVFQAIEQGDSCIQCAESQALQLQGLSIDAEQAAAQVIAPFIFDGQHLYLYRYWALEHQLAQAAAQLKRQNIQTAQLTEQHMALLSDAQQQRALQMVAANALSIITGGPGMATPPERSPAAPPTPSTAGSGRRRGSFAPLAIRTTVARRIMLMPIFR